MDSQKIIIQPKHPKAGETVALKYYGTPGLYIEACYDDSSNYIERAGNTDCQKATVDQSGVANLSLKISGTPGTIGVHESTPSAPSGGGVGRSLGSIEVATPTSTTSAVVSAAFTLAFLIGVLYLLKFISRSFTKDK